MDRKALLIIDMQKGSFTNETPRFDTENVIKRINKLSSAFRKKGESVIFIQHDGSKENAFVPGNNDWEILDNLKIVESDLIISKTANDAFYESNLENKLKELNIDQLYITGCATDFCVEATIQSAITKNYNITVVKNAHTTGERPFLTSRQVIEHYNWIWENMIPTKGSLKVNDSENVITQIDIPTNTI